MLQYVIFPKKKTFINEVKALNKGDIADSQLIWKAFQGSNSQQNVSYFCLQIFQHVLHSQKKIYLIQNQQRLYATLLLLQVLKNRKQKSPEIIQQCRNFIQKMKPSLGKTLLQFLFRSNKDYGFAQFFMNSLAMVPKEIDETSDIGQQIKTQIRHVQEFREKVKNSYYLKSSQMLKTECFPKNYVLDTKLLAFGYFCLTEHIKNNNNMVKPNQFDHLRNVLRYLMDGAKSVNLQQYLLKFIHLIIKIITFYGCFNVEVVKDLMIWADKLKQFPGSIGQLGGYLFRILLQQLKLPGSAFRKKLRSDFVSLDMKDSVFINKQFYLITDDQSLYNRHQDQSLITLRKMLIIHILRVAQIEEKLMGDFVPFLKQLNQQTTFILYEKLIKILQVVEKIETVSKIKQILRQYIPKLLLETKQRYEKSSVMDNTIQSEQFEIFMKKINKFGIFQYPSYQIISVPISQFIGNKDKVFSLHRIINKNKADYQGKFSHRAKIPLVFNGTGQSFSYFIGAITQHLQKTDSEQMRQLEIYFINRHDNAIVIGLGRYLSYKDPWYNSFVYNIHKQKTLYPHIDMYKLNKDLFPYYLYSKNLQLYLRQAKYSMMVHVYKCTIKTDKYQVVYMTSFCMMGLFCQAKIIKMNKQRQKGKQQRYQNKQLIEIINQKIKKPSLMLLNLQIECVQPLTGYVIIKKQQNIKLEDLQICNISHEYFMGKCPNSSVPTLQMTLLTDTNGRIFRKQINRSQNFKEGRSFNEINEAFKDLFICRTIKKIRIQNSNLSPSNQLKIIVDGRVFTDVEQINIEPACSLDQTHIILPIQCFLPVS